LADGITSKCDQLYFSCTLYLGHWQQHALFFFLLANNLLKGMQPHSPLTSLTEQQRTWLPQIYKEKNKPKAKKKTNKGP
jgi:hypothetical protein